MKSITYICYDITSNKGRRDLAKLLCKYGRRIQYSVFMVEIQTKNLKNLKHDIIALCNNKYYNKSTDSIMMIKTCESCHSKKWVWGRSINNYSFMII